MYQQAQSYFSGTELASSGLPSNEELKWLTPWKKTLPEELFKKPFVVPGSRVGLGDPIKGDRIKRAKALKLLKQAGWHIKSNQQVNKHGEHLELTAITHSPDHERVFLSLKQGLKYLGITLNVHRVDTLQYVERIRELDFELVAHIFPHTASPGTEQQSLWGSTTVDQQGTKNLAGASLPVIDDLTKRIPEATSRKELISMVHALDRVLLWNHYSLPLWYMPSWPIVHKTTLRYPDTQTKYALDLSTWWYQE
jgi:microcin C transport system substrate-binding protein